MERQKEFEKRHSKKIIDENTAVTQRDLEEMKEVKEDEGYESESSSDETTGPQGIVGLGAEMKLKTLTSAKAKRRLRKKMQKQ